MANQQSQEGDTSTAARGTPGADSGSSVASEGDTSQRGGGEPGDTGTSGSDPNGRLAALEAKFADLKADRDDVLAKNRAYEERQAKLAEAFGFAEVPDDDDPKVAIKRLRDELNAERSARQESEKRLARERVLAGAADAEQARIVLAGLEATGAVSLSPDDPSTSKAARELLEASFPHLFAKSKQDSEQDPKPPRKRVPGPKNGKSEFELPQELFKDGRRIL